MNNSPTKNSQQQTFKKRKESHFFSPKIHSVDFQAHNNNEIHLTYEELVALNRTKTLHKKVMNRQHALYSIIQGNANLYEALRHMGEHFNNKDWRATHTKLAKKLDCSVSTIKRDLVIIMSWEDFDRRPAYTDGHKVNVDGIEYPDRAWLYVQNKMAAQLAKKKANDVIKNETLSSLNLVNEPTKTIIAFSILKPTVTDKNVDNSKQFVETPQQKLENLNKFLAKYIKSGAKTIPCGDFPTNEMRYLHFAIHDRPVSKGEMAAYLKEYAQYGLTRKNVLLIEKKQRQCLINKKEAPIAGSGYLRGYLDKAMRLGIVGKKPANLAYEIESKPKILLTKEDGKDNKLSFIKEKGFFADNEPLPQKTIDLHDEYMRENGRKNRW